MYATARAGSANRGLVAGAVNVNVACVGIHVAAPVESGLETFEPEYASGDFCIGQAFPCIANGLARLENCAGRPAVADLFGDAMQAQGSAIGAFDLADTKARSRTSEFFEQLIFTAETLRRRDFFEKRNGLIGNIDCEY